MTAIGTAARCFPDIALCKRTIARRKHAPTLCRPSLKVVIHLAQVISALLGGPLLPTMAHAEPVNPPTASDTRAAAENTRQFAADSWITAQLKSRLLADETSKNFPISVETKAGAVALKGSLPDQDSIDHVKYLAESIAGVNSVDIGGLKIIAK